MAGGVDPIYGAALLDAYGPLLTERQREACALVFEEDWSLSEAAHALGVSRARVGALVGDAVRRLVRIEERLHVVSRQAARLSLLQEGGTLVDSGAPPEVWRDFLVRWRRIEEGTPYERPDRIGGSTAEGEARMTGSEGTDADV
ncbi:MAG: hypothetical protein M1516_00820 [Firmicutes bacterium]|jgi:hypothetical protein|nr:hypothetical protein [Bacillota bacterium]